jgi:Lhr-like helicase
VRDDIRGRVEPVDGAVADEVRELVGQSRGLALSLKRLAPDVAVECVRAFLEVEAEDPAESASIDLIREL